MSAHPRFSKAPVSEVILGLNFNELVLPIPALFKLQGALEDEYPAIEVTAPLLDESLANGMIKRVLDPSKSGQFLLRLRTSDRKWLVQLQGNKVYFNWSRLDSEPVGHYPGFDAIFGRFHKVIDIVKETVGLDCTTADLFDLTYQDRISWGSVIPDLSQISMVLKIPHGPNLNHETQVIDYKQVYTVQELGGHGTSSIQTGVMLSTEESQLIQFQNVLVGNVDGMSFADWMQLARQKQLEIFMQTFQESLVETWK